LAAVASTEIGRHPTMADAPKSCASAGPRLDVYRGL